MREWFETAFGEFYPILYAHRDDVSAAQEVEGLIEVLGRPDRFTRVLDVGCGGGRHAAALVGLGAHLYGIDLSAPLVTEAAHRPELRGRMVRGDMRELPFGAAFDLVVNLFTSFGYFADDHENERALREMARVLRPGGRMVIDHIHRRHLEDHLVAEDEREGEGYRVRQRRTLTPRRIQKEITVTWDSGKTQEFIEDVRLYSPGELTALLRAGGLTDIDLYGSFDGGVLAPESKRMIAVAVKPD